MARDFEYDVFLSHSSMDKPAVRQLAERLKGDRLRVWLDEWVIQPGDSIPLAIENGLESSRTLVLVMSKCAFASEWVTLERHVALFRDPTNKQKRFIPLRLDDAELPGTLKIIKCVDWREKDDQEYRRLVSACGRDLPDAVAEIAFSRQQVEESGFPFEYGSDLHWLWGWGYCLRSMLDDELEPSQCTWIIFRPDRLARDAMMRFSVVYPHIIKQIDDFLDFTEERYKEFLQDDNDSNRSNFVDAMDDLCVRIEAATPIIGAKSEVQ